MKWSPFGNSEQVPTGRAERTAERFRCDTMVCPIGPVVDVSATGLRIKLSEPATFRPGDTLSLALTSHGQTVKVQGSVARIIKKFFRPAELGVSFINLTPSQAAAVVQLGRFGYCEVRDKAPAAKPKTASRDVPIPPPPPKSTSPIQAGVEIEDLYEVLGVASNATNDQVRDAYRDLAKRYHPDHCKEDGAPERFARISKAFSVLRDPKLRANYDVMLARSLAA